jgi:hypothetical protein
VKAYHHARTREYDDFRLRGGRFAERDLPGWDEEVDELATGLDRSDAMLAVASERLPDATFVVDDAFDVPFPDAAFERVFATFFSCHLVADEWPRLVAEARRVACELPAVGSRPGDGDPPERREERVLDDGSRRQVFKRVFDPDEFAGELGGRAPHDGRWPVAVAA